MKSNRVLKNEALSSLKGNWAPAVLASFVLFLAASVLEGPYIFMSLRAVPGWLPSSSYTVGITALWVVILLVVMPLEVGHSNACRALLAKGDGNMLSNEFKIGFSAWLHKFWTYFLRSVCIFLWSLLLIVPGIVKALAYDMADFIMVEEPNLSAYQAIKKSEVITKGHKNQLFGMYLGMLGWYLLSVLTLGLGFLWLLPYVNTTRAAFYEALKEEGEVRKVDY